ncbi:hypothetical protein KOY48_03550 [Candidatus Minimicrobia naudis]|uniref:Uncharacterized protein n=1 Tax=Candidatus Minimicrobia naudis TaxID=2841263 RepID=A0A8F1MBE0_9BACT|nr:hypothetical protein KOY48_03550 [Candidatus Minimicrobia naudis]
MEQLVVSGGILRSSCAAMLRLFMQEARLKRLQKKMVWVTLFEAGVLAAHSWRSSVRRS